MAIDDKNRRRGAAAAIAVAIAIPAEGLRQWAYYDPPGILTVCYGSTTDVQKGKKYSLDECKDRLDADMREAISQVDACAPGLPVPVLAAFGDAVYNIGPRIACDTRASAAAMRCSAARTSGRWRSVSAGMASARSCAGCGTATESANNPSSASGACPVSTARLWRDWARPDSSAGICAAVCSAAV